MQTCKIISYVRILHASPDAPPVDIYANGSLIAQNLAYKDFTKYLPLNFGRYNIKVYPTGKKDIPVIDTILYIPKNKIFTVAAINRLEDIDLYPIEDPQIIIPNDKACLRFIHLSPNAPNVDLKIKDGNYLFQNIAYKGVTNYVQLYPNKYYFQLLPTGTQDVVLSVPNTVLKANKAYTIYAVGLVNDQPPLQVLIPLDGNTYIKF